MDVNVLTLLAVAALVARGGHALHTIGAVRARSVADAAIRALVGSATLVLALFVVGKVLGLIAITPGTTFGVSLNRAATVEGPAVHFASPVSLLEVIALALLPMAIVEAATAERLRLWGGVAVALFVALAGGGGAIGAGWALVSALDSPAAAGLSGPWPIIAAHLVGGGAAIACARAAGPRRAKYNRDGSANFIPPHNVALLVAGDLLLLIGLPAIAGLVAGEPAARVLNALLAASAAVVAATIACQVRERRVDVVSIFAASVAGAAAGSVSSPALHGVAIALGAIVGALLPILAVKLDLRFRVDDPTGLALPHLLGGLAGAVGASLDVMAFDASASLVATAVGLAATFSALALVIAVAAGLLATLIARAAGLLRVADDVESEGVDLALHDVNAYPDFQQTMIKSYHLRQ